MSDFNEQEILDKIDELQQEIDNCQEEINKIDIKLERLEEALSIQEKNCKIIDEFDREYNYCKWDEYIDNQKWKGKNHDDFHEILYSAHDKSYGKIYSDVYDSYDLIDQKIEDLQDDRDELQNIIDRDNWYIDVLTDELSLLRAQESF